MEALYKLIAENEDWLMDRVLQYAKERDYVKYTSTLAEAWRISIASLSEAILAALQTPEYNVELGPDEDYTYGPIAAFGIEEAQKHRSRGITLGMFLSLLKYYRQSYIDLILQAGFEFDQKETYRRFVERCFDRVELGLCTEWATSTSKEQLHELQASNRFLANEKNKYLTIFESLHDPVILLDSKNQITNMNHAAAQLLTGSTSPGDVYYDRQPTTWSIPWLNKELETLANSHKIRLSFEKTLNTAIGIRHFDINLERMLDVSEKFSGTVVLLTDVTESKRAAIMEERERLAQELHDSVTQSLYSLTLFTEWGRGLLETGEIESACERMARIGEISQQALKEMRLLLYELRPSALEQDGLVGALKGRLSAVEQRVGVTTCLQAETVVNLPASLEECLYRIAQEALNNALKHAEATDVTVKLETSDKAVWLTVTDNGKGFEPHTVNNNGGMGLNSMRTRVKRLGGTVEIISAKDKGTTIKVQTALNGNSTRINHTNVESLVEVVQ